jgi:glycosyltransferase involved in cell wall biosynthesis
MTPRLARVAIIGCRGIPAQYGGFETFVAELAPRLVNRGFAVTVYCRPNFSDPSRPRVYRGVELVYIPTLNWRPLESPVHETLSLLHALFRGRFDILFVLAFRASPIYLSVRATRAHLFFNTDGLDWKRRRWGRIARAVLRFNEYVGVLLAPRRLVADSHAIAEYFSRKYGVTPQVVMYGAPAVTRVSPPLVEHFGLRSDGYYLVVCRLEPENNVDVIIRGFVSTSTMKQLVIVGSSTSHSAYYRLLRQIANSRVVFLGAIYETETIAQLYAHAYGYIHGHEVGGTNPALVQAMAAGAFVLAHAVVYNREVVGDCGWLWERTPDALRGLIERADADPQTVRAIGAAAKVRAQTYYDWDQIAEEYAHLFESDLRERG